MKEGRKQAPPGKKRITKQIRIEEDLVDAVSEIADREEITETRALNEALRRGVESDEPEDDS